MAEQKITTSFKIPLTLQNELLQKIICDGYGMRGKTKWIIESIETFLQLPNYPELVEFASDSEGHQAVISIRLPESTVVKIEEAILEVRKKFPLLEGVKGSMIRASIYQRLIRTVGDRQII